VIRIWRAKANRLLVISLLLIFFILGFSTLHTRGAEAEVVVDQTTFNVGFRILDFKYPQNAGKKILSLAVWYPAAAAPGSHTYGGPTTGRVAVGAVPLIEKGPYPLLIFSHGYGGGGISSVFFTEQLAARGWVVAAPDHFDKYPAVRSRTGPVADFDRTGFWRYAREIGASGPGDRHKYLYRLDEMQFAVNSMVDSKAFRKVIDSSRIAVGGHSFGGYTALGLCGTIKERYDSRIKAVLLFSTGAGGYLYRESELAAVKMPSMLFMGAREKDQMRGSKTMSEISDKIYTNLQPPNYFLEVRDANHFSFNNRFVDNRRSRWLSGTDEQFEVIRRYSIAFLEKHVAGKTAAGLVLDHSDPMLTRYERQPNPGGSKRGPGTPEKEK